MGRLSGLYVFGYGSLVAEDATRGATVVRLHGFRRSFGVAMDNREAIPGYKAYREPGSGGSRPAYYVAFLDLEPDPTSLVNGTLRALSRLELDALDRRERNYDRVEVTHQVAGNVGAPVFAYFGSAAGRERLRRGRADGSAVVVREYLDRVRAAFAALGLDEERAFLASTDLDALPVRELERVEVPA